MRHLYWELSSGAAGDMLLASLLAAGADESRLREGLNGLNVSGWSLRVQPVLRAGIQGLQVLVEDYAADDPLHQSDAPQSLSDHAHHHPPHSHHCHSHDGKDQPHDHALGHDRDSGHGHAHSHTHSHDHHDRSDGHAHGHANGAHRHLADLLKIVHDSVLSQRVKERAGRVFRLLAEAEGAVHGKPPEEVHFHEISGIDTLIDVCGVCLALELMQVERITASPVATGAGHVHCAHGVLPVPAPATLAILQRCRIPFHAGDVQKELLTPTGAALLGVLAEDFGPCPAGVALSCGYGAGGRDFPQRANSVRALLLEDDAADATSAGTLCDYVLEYRTALDDVTGEEAGRVLEVCYAAGALEAYLLPAVMKKSRPGQELVVLAPEGAAACVEAAIFRSGATLGMRKSRLGRVLLPRMQRTVTVEGQAVRVKSGTHEGRMVFVKAEYDDSVRVSESTGLSLREVRQRARDEFGQAGQDL